ncbi:MAG: UDP-N-acetylmuramate--L-alanine ligase [Clostridia bacterium]|nr:UDP-N-acetylmuramate--L-alanine ligase [Clostridia bacterium]
MKQSIFFGNYRRIHFIGIGGVSMSGLAKYCLVNGFSVSGSDKRWSTEIARLASLGAKVFIGRHRAENANNAQLVVYSSAVSKDNPELCFAQKNGVPVLKRSELLGQILGLHKKTVAVSGSHGKTTTTALIAEIMIAAGSNPTVFLGGERKTFGNFRSGGKDFAVAEACEYKKNFLDIHPDIAVVLNVDDDHADTFSNMDCAAAAFSAFAASSLAVVNADDEYARRAYNSSTVSFGLKNIAAYTAKYIKDGGKEGGVSFCVYAYGKKLGRIKLKLSGRHNVYNALAAVAVSCELKIPFSVIKSAAESFDGVKRRNEYLGEWFGKPCVADYAHHPTEIRAFITGRKAKSGKVLVVFQPHTYSRTAALMKKFISALSLADGLILYKTYPAREKFSESGDCKTLYYNISKTFGGNLRYCGTRAVLLRDIKALSRGFDEILVIGAGDVYDVVKKEMNTKNIKKM